MVFNIFNDTTIRDITPEERYMMASTLKYMYRGTGAIIDRSNIADVARIPSIVSKLQRHTLSISIVKDVIDVENRNCVNPPTLRFVHPNETPVSNKVHEYIYGLLNQCRFNEFLLAFEREAALEGTVFVRPTFTKFDRTLTLSSLTPAYASLEVVPDDEVPGRAASISYEIGDTVHMWDYFNYTIIKDGLTTSTPHGFKASARAIGGLPYAVLNYFPDNSCVFGPPDGMLYTFCKQQSLMLANICAKLNLSDQEKLLLMGVETFEEASQLIKPRLIMLPNNKYDTTSGQHIPQSAQFISPTGDDILNALEAYFKIYNHIKDVRGHAAKNFSRGSDPQSAEAVRLGGVDMRDKNAAKKLAIQRFIKDLWRIAIWANNTQEQPEMLIPADTEVVIDWKPDGLSFNSAQDEVTYFNAAILADVETPVTWLRTRNPELSEEEAQALYESRKEFNAKDRGADAAVNDTPPIDPSTQDQNLDNPTNNTNANPSDNGVQN